MSLIDRLKEKIKYIENIRINTDKLRQLRYMQNIDQKMMGELLGIKVNSYSNKENNKRQFTLTELVKISVLLDCDIEDFLTDDEFEIE